MKLKNSTGRPYFWQWDLNQKLIVEDDCTCKEVHFCNRASKTSLVCLIEEVDGERFANVPNILLQTDGVITAYLCSRTDDGGETRLSRTFQVRPRTKPESYVYTETEVLNYHSLADRIEQIEQNGVSDEKIGQAVADYLDKNGIESGATADEAAQIQQNKTDIEQLAKEKLDADKLPEAVNEALTQAKESGEFKGEPGYTPQKGIDYFDGEPGEPGKTPEKGKDYFTDADKQEIAEQAAQLVEVPEGGTSSGGMSSAAVNLLIKILKSAQYAEDQTANILALETALKTGGSGEVEQPESGVEQIGNILSIVSGVTVTQTGSVLEIA